MDVQIREDGRAVTIAFVGELDHHAAKETVTRMERALDASLPTRLTLDFSGVTFMDSSGIAVAMRARRRMAALGGTIAIINVPAQAKKVFDAAGIACAAKTEGEP